MLAESTPQVKQRLSERHKLLVDHYLTDAYFNKTLAGKMVGIKQPQVEVERILQKPVVNRYLQERMNAEMASRQESMIDLSRMANGTMQYFIDSKTGMLDLTSPNAIAHYGYLRSITQDTEERVDASGNPITRTRTKIEVVDKLAARTVLVKIQGLLSEGNPPPSVTINSNTLVMGNIVDQMSRDGINPADVLAEMELIRQELLQLIPPPVVDTNVIDVDSAPADTTTPPP